MEKSLMRYMIDIDGTICEQTNVREMNSEFPDYSKSKPYLNRVEQINKLYDEGHEIHYWTARGTVSGIDWYDRTKQQLDKWGAKYHELNVGKPHYDIWVDDKAREIDNFFQGS
tara:strand:+ start:2301 stop:2639 length:339 start_codon:yes stop_codon:yes gene_type:complete